MTKRLLLCAGVLGVIASVAVAGPATLVQMPRLGTDISSEARAVSADGQWVAGISQGKGVLWNPSTGFEQQVVAGGTWGFTQATGVGVRTVGGVDQVVISGLSSGYVAVATWDGSTFGQFYRDGVTAGQGQGAYNTLGATKGTDAFYWAWKVGNYTIKNSLGTGANTVQTDSKSSTSPARMSTASISGAGLTAGWRTDANNTQRQSYYQQHTGNGTGAVGFITGLDGGLKLEAGAAAGDNLTGKIFGVSNKPGDTVNSWPYQYSFATGLTTPLPMYGDEQGSVTRGYVYGASPDGRWASGMIYRGMERAALWDTQTGTVIDLTDWASNHGILDGFTGNLRRAYTVGVNAEGFPVIAGVGVGPNGANNIGFVLTLPEPATLAFLALGALPLLRRRR